MEPAGNTANGSDSSAYAVGGVSDHDQISDARAVYDDCMGRESHNRAEARDDILFRMGGDNQWDAAWMRREQRANLRQSTITVNQLPQYINQVINDLRQNRPAVKVRPVDDKGDEEVAEIYDGIVRHAQYVGKANDARDVAAEHAVVHGLGWYRIKTDYTDPMSFDQEPVYQGFDEPWNVYHNDFRNLDGSDLRDVVIASQVSRSQFEKMYPGAKVVSWGEANESANGDDVVVAEHYCIKTRADKLLMLKDGAIMLETEAAKRLAAGEVLADLDRERSVEVPYVYWCKLSGAEELEKRELLGSIIPVFPVIGNVARVDGKVHRWGIVRFAKDPQRYYNFLKSAEVEWIESAPKSPWVGDARSFEPYKEYWQQANKVNYGYLPLATTDGEGNPLPMMPQRNAPVAIPSGIMQAELAATDDIKKALGMYSAAIGAHGNATSGKQELLQQHESDTGTFHYADNLAKTVMHEGKMLVEWIPKLYGARRVARIIGQDDEAQAVRLTQALPRPVTKVQMQDGVKKVYNLGVGRYDVAVTVGPSYATKRMEAQSFMTELVRADPTLMAKAGDIILRNFDQPGADELSKRLKAFLPPQVLQSESEDEDQNSPERLQMALAQVQQQAQQLQQREQMLAQIDAKMDERDREIEGKTAEAKAEMAAVQAERKVLEARAKEIEARLTLATMQAKQELQATVPQGAPDAGESTKLQAEKAVFEASKREAMAVLALRLKEHKDAVREAVAAGRPVPEVDEALEGEDEKERKAAAERKEAEALARMEAAEQREAALMMQQSQAIAQQSAMLAEATQAQTRALGDMSVMLAQVASKIGEPRDDSGLVAEIRKQATRTQEAIAKAVKGAQTRVIRPIMDEEGNIIGGDVQSADGGARRVEIEGAE